MSALADKLRGLRRQAGTAAASPSRQAVAPEPSSALAQLHRLRRPSRPGASVLDREVAGRQIAPGLYLHEKHYDWPEHQPWLDAGFARLEPIETARLLYFDTETTGLAGGTGTRAFMIGAGDWCEGRLRLRQLLITTLGAERAMLAEFACWFDAHTALVSYNGKCYDAPLLATRYRLARMDNPLAGRTHVDLLHPVRRHWRKVWPNCRLATAEQRLLNVVREDDLPGSEAPAAWLGYLRGGSAHNLRRVGEHNAQDIVSLAGIAGYMSALPAQPEAAMP
ncbi:ribonuclease H-like domain-containing protein [Oleiagrimonas sp. C23AA]|uniref:ribonuclease H-like domain-containing protein n=1 Tax=Oleiagrimonas sp. C23AA TaxID=2719047 RepID=UPI00141E245D|nr:ribonuclease H-like domain-containing protein [Oleiagrimonas sp. C23AA]NII11491.1 ribonuclease H-like domain-containing protein [Oleiagrimonas sp. C23AA]